MELLKLQAYIRVPALRKQVYIPAAWNLDGWMISSPIL